MYHEEITLKLIGKTIMNFPEIDHNKLRNIIEEVIYNYEIYPQTKALTTLSDLYERIMDYLVAKKLRGMSKGTIYNYKLQLVRFSKYISKNVNQIEAVDIRFYMATLLKEKELKKTSMSSVISILKSFFSWMFIQGYITKNIMEKIDNIKCEKRLRKPLTSEEMELLRDACTTLRERAIIECFYATGCRLSECVNIKIGDIKWDKYLLTVIGKGNKERIVYLTPCSKVHIQKYLESRTDITNNSPLFISSKYPHDKLGGRAIEAEFHRIQNKAGITVSVFPHKIRSTTASEMVSRNISLSSIQKIYGHESIVTTTRYAQITDDTAQQEYNKYFAH